MTTGSNFFVAAFTLSMTVSSVCAPMAGVFLPLVGVVANRYPSCAMDSVLSSVIVTCSGLS
ncbi:hypothetical protein PF010_g30754 [Phytophthora fragariae]|uniref:Uncharacterized protein n=1 Tax=Phytophthora fragariae TaxID=53985 RepID=A0A6A3PQH3_9STRA|nr:hypothetical protein PF009_g31474 [Phytophthora fragariae]KAE8957113.1 hypothetical protein PF011_g31251 [Phytophthora fragariae]KAE9058534.1 hypothetical protein PF007_g31267 [Phytophthora fragariae]KAE9059094.1 hypothetical protein PF010_g30754 [Phytophthora fragariae]KAE9063584.1 hypothetical protein PF006_g30908 [Phytophthora fragariae]